MNRPAINNQVRRGLSWLAEYGRAFLEADGWETPDAVAIGDIEAALDWIERGGLYCDPDHEKGARRA